jgi:Fe-coproporphyrin III synthase
LKEPPNIPLRFEFFIGMNLNAFLNIVSNQSRALPIVILYVTEGCNLQCIMCSYRAPSPKELTVAEINVLADQLFGFGLRQIVFSGGEPLTRRDLGEICEIFKRKRIHQTLLTNGLLLEKRSELLHYFSEVIVSLDGSTSATHDSIRGVRSFDQILHGIKQVTGRRVKPRLSLRTVIQKKNFRELPAFVHLARSIGADGISFLAVDVLSDAFSRDATKPLDDNSSVLLDAQEILEFRDIIDKMSVSFKKEFESSFIAESPGKLRHIAEYFAAVRGLAPFPKNQCNAPMVSTVITSIGDVKPCFFLPSIGNIRNDTIPNLLNGKQAKNNRTAVREYRMERCQTCVCTLRKGAMDALMDNFQ